MTFQTVAAVLGSLLIVGALLSGVARRSVLALAPLFLLTGFVLGNAGVLEFDARSEFVADLATTALVVILFRDGLEVDGEVLQEHWRLPLRKIVIGMPVTTVVTGAIAHLAVGLPWLEAMLLGALLSPTDPVLSSSVVTDERVPGVVRHSLNLESGLNDGLALPVVLALAAALDSTTQNFEWWRFVLEDVGLGFAFGIAWGLLGSVLLQRSSISSYQRALLGLGLAFATYGFTRLIGYGNGFIAVFVAAIVLGVRCPDLLRDFERGAQTIVEIVKVAIFTVFGSLLTLHGLTADGAAAFAVVAGTFLLARPLAIALALAGTRVDRAGKLFVAWFGPRGVATIAFSLALLSRHVPDQLRIFNLAALTVVCSVILHGISDTPGVEWLVRREQRAAAQAPS